MPVYVYRFRDEIIEEYFPIGEAPAAIRHPLYFNRWYERYYTPLGLKVDKGEFFSPAFGKVFKNEKDQKDYAKHMGLVPLENASVDSVHKWEKQNEIDREKKLDAELDDVIRSVTA
jgi:hypothetical protein